MPDVTSPFGFPYPENTDLVRDGAQDIENLAEGVNDYLDGGFLYAGTRYYTSSGTFAKADPLGTGDIGLRAIRVRLAGGGGGGRGGLEAVRPGGGGGGGGYAESFITDIASLSASETVTCGSGGTGGAAGGASGSSGGASSFGAVNATGGAGSDASARGNPGGSGSGDLVMNGGSSTGQTYGDGGTRTGGSGGGSFLSGGGAHGGYGSVGIPGPLYGGGGGGGGYTPSAEFKGGDGADGIVIIDCYV